MRDELEVALVTARPGGGLVVEHGGRDQVTERVMASSKIAASTA